MKKILLILLIAMILVNGATIMCKDSPMVNSWTNPETWIGDNVPSLDDFVVVRKCHLELQIIDNITISGLLIDTNYVLTVSGNLIVTNFMENRGYLKIYPTGHMTSLVYFSNIGILDSLGMLSIYTHYSNRRQINLTNSSIFFHMSDATNIGELNLDQSFVHTDNSLVLDDNNYLDISGVNYIYGNLINKFGTVTILSSSILHVDSYFQHGSTLLVSLHGLLNATKLNINGSL